ncbi:MAG: UPF0158 family protein [Bacilli bacterium]|nr:UPF0158 family protein [Bacilli bacterium]MDD4795428.1 UPF0158 family protein [Bacilli bacterium]
MLKLSEVILAIETTNMEISTYYNKKTNEVLYQSDYDSQLSTYTEDDEYNDDIILMFNFGDKNDYKIMESFVYSLDNINIKNELINKIQGRGCFERFKESINYHNIDKDWYEYRDKKYKNIAVNWCNINKIKYEDDIKWS